MTRRISKHKLIIISCLLLFTVSIAIVSIFQAYQLNQNHAEMLSFIESISSNRLDELKAKYSSGYEIYYALTALTGIYAPNHNDLYYDDFKMERWTVELQTDSTESILISVPEISWNPKYVDLKQGGWQLSGEVGSSITLYHPKLNPDNAGRLTLEVIGRNARGVVFMIGQPAPIQR